LPNHALEAPLFDKRVFEVGDDDANDDCIGNKDFQVKDTQTVKWFDHLAIPDLSKLK